MVYRAYDAYGRVTDERSCTGRNSELVMSEFFSNSVKMLTKRYDNQSANDSIRAAFQANLASGLKGALVDKLNENAG